MKKISIVLPVYNNIPALERGLPFLKAFLEKSGNPYEVLVVDDGSALPEMIAQLAIHHECRLIRLEHNAGKGMAVRRGIHAATGDLLIFMDGDFPFELSVISRMAEALQNSSVAIGDRTLAASSYPKEVVLQRKIGSRILSWIISCFYVSGIRDSQCGIKGFHANVGKAIFKRVSLSGFSFDVEVLFIAQKNGLPISKVPVQVFAQDQSSVCVLKDGLLMLLSLVRIQWNNARGKYILHEQEMDK